MKGVREVEEGAEGLRLGVVCGFGIGGRGLMGVTRVCGKGFRVRGFSWGHKLEWTLVYDSNYLADGGWGKGVVLM